MKVRSRKLLWLVRIIVLVLLLAVIGCLSTIRLDSTGLIIQEEKEFVMYPEKDKRIVLEGLVGRMALSDNGERGVYIQSLSDNQVQIAEVNLKTCEITTLVTAEQLEKGMREAGETAYTGKIQERPKSVKYVKNTDAVSFIWANSLYTMDLESGKIQCVLRNYDQSPLAVEGLEYEWIDENRFVYVTVDRFNCIFLYNLLTHERQFVQYGSGVCSYNEDGRIVCYEKYIKDSTIWVQYYEFTVINIQSFEKEKTLTYKIDELISQNVEHAIFHVGDNGIIVWGEENGNRLYLCDYQSRITWIKILPGKKVYSIL